MKDDSDAYLASIGKGFFSRLETVDIAPDLLNDLLPTFELYDDTAEVI